MIATSLRIRKVNFCRKIVILKYISLSLLSYLIEFLHTTCVWRSLLVPYRITDELLDMPEKVY